MAPGVFLTSQGGRRLVETLLHTLDVLACACVNFERVAFIDEGWHGDAGSRFQRRLFGDIRCGVAANGNRRLHDLQDDESR